jgi:predicted Zn-dependent protease
VQEHFHKDVHPFPDVWLLAGRVLVAQGEMAKAMTTLEHAAREFPKDYRIWTLIGEAHIRQGGEAEGLKSLRRSLEINGAYAPTYLWLAKASYGNPLQAVWLKKVLVLESKDSPIATEALAMLKKLEERSGAQPPAGGDGKPAPQP